MTTERSCSGGDNSSNSSRSSHASKNCKVRDNYTCIFCGYHHEEGIALEAAHVLEIEKLNKKSYEERENLLRSMLLFGRNDIVNLLTLCQQCHYFFDKRGGYRIRIDPTSRTLVVHDSIKGEKSMSGKTYAELHGIAARICPTIQHAVTKELLEYRYAFTYWTPERTAS